MSDNDCIFCKIVNREIPSEFIFEDDDFVVFRDIKPHAPVHILIVPRKHIRSINDITEDDRDIMSKFFFLAKKIAEQEGIARSGYKLLFNVEKGGDQFVFHLHLHLLGDWK
ncbi:MAG: histidine triad nucleotide-binding protein [Thermodesulfobacteriota bacterium]|nr:histidine triad nucleotide-binding protein [Thermodesulfobacteriota bacterium]